VVGFSKARTKCSSKGGQSELSGIRASSRYKKEKRAAQK